MNEVLAGLNGGGRGVAEAGVTLPRISVVIPNFNGEAYLERTILSVLEQGYPDLEVIVIDGGSSDRSVEIIKKYASRLTYWESAKDRGQAHAINKGFAKATGEVVNWLCSDDRLMPGALLEVGERFAREPGLEALVGGCVMEYVGDPARSGPSWTLRETIALVPCTNPINQPSCYYRRRLLRAKPLDESYHYAMDTELWSYFNSIGVKWGMTDAVLSEYLHTGVNKTMTGGKKILRELDRLYRAYYPGEALPLCDVTRFWVYPLSKRKSERAGRWDGKVAAGMLSMAWGVVGRLYGFERLAAQVQTYAYFDPDALVK